MYARKTKQKMDFVLISFIGICIRCLIGIFPYSGYQKPPMHGDFEAQRHWMEITYNLPVNQWYENSTENDLLYWGLDYPPLTAYHSWICGAISHMLNSSWVELGKSRGLEFESHKIFMRASVLVADLLVYFPAVFVYFRCSSKLKNIQLWCSLVTLLYPGLLLIDHGHFQYNCISLGLALWGVAGIRCGRDLLASAAFVLALNYKQMELYHAVPFFCFLLATCFHGKENWFVKLVKLGAVVIATFALCWLPFLSNPGGALQVLRRLFPFDRGLYEDKVSNVWCSLSPVLKFKEIFDQQSLIWISMAATVLCLLPSSVHVLARPSHRRFLLALVISSLTFFLFSFQVHEKSILIVALPVLLLWPDAPYMCTWFLHISTFSMLPLLIKDGLVVPYFALSFVFYLIAKTAAQDLPHSPESIGLVTKIGGVLSVLGALGLSIASLTVPPPARFPDLWPVLVSVYSCAHFVLFFLYFNYWLCVHDTEETLKKTTGTKDVVARQQLSKATRKSAPTSRKDQKVKKMQ